MGSYLIRFGYSDYEVVALNISEAIQKAYDLRLEREKKFKIKNKEVMLICKK